MGARRGRVGFLLRRTGRAILAHSPDGVGEHSVLAAAGAVTALLVLLLGVATAWSVHERDLALGSATGAARRLASGGVDDEVEQKLFKLQSAELGLYQARSDTGSTDASAAQQGDTDTDTGTQTAPELLTSLESELAGVTSPAASHAHAVAIVQELTVYTGLEATAQSDNRTGLPVGAAYLREASRYLTTYMLVNAEEIRAADQHTVTSEDAAAAVFPGWLVFGDAVTAVWLVVALVGLAGFTRRSLNAGVAGALVVALALITWSLAGILLARDRLDGSAAPASAAATGLAQVRFDADTVNIDDQLTFSDNGEDCVFTTSNPTATTPGSSADPYASAYKATCAYESSAKAELAPGTGTLTQDLDKALAAVRDPKAAAALRQITAQVAAWYADEDALPTLQNLNADVKGVLAAGRVPRFDQSFNTILMRYAEPSSQGSSPTAREYDAISALVDPQQQWQAYDTAASAASSLLDGLVLGAVLLGVLGAVAAAAGIGVRTADYWSRGARDTPRYTSIPVAQGGSKG